MRITEVLIRKIVRGILAESSWEAYDKAGFAQNYRTLVGAEELKKLESQLIAIHWTNKQGVENITSGKLRVPWVSVSVYHLGSVPVVSHKNRGIWGTMGLILRGDWLFGSINDAFTGEGGTYGTEESGLEMLPPHEENIDLIRSISDVPRRPTASAQTEILLGDPTPVGIIVLPSAQWQIKRIKDEYEEMEAAGEILPLDQHGNALYGQPEPAHWYEDDDYLDYPETPYSEAEYLARQTGLPLYDHNLRVIS